MYTQIFFVIWDGATAPLPITAASLLSGLINIPPNGFLFAAIYKTSMQAFTDGSI
jgi:hypothetical protein